MRRCCGRGHISPGKASDITVLVRSRQEALIRDALTSLNIPSVYLSNRDSVFETLEAQGDAVGAAGRCWRRAWESTLRSALANSMLD